MAFTSHTAHPLHILPKLPSKAAAGWIRGKSAGVIGGMGVPSHVVAIKSWDPKDERLREESSL